MSYELQFTDNGENSVEMHRSMDILRDGLDRKVIVGANFEAFDELMRFYYPDPEDLLDAYSHLLAPIINQGLLEHCAVKVTPSNPAFDLDLSTDRMEHEFPSNLMEDK